MGRERKSAGLLREILADRQSCALRGTFQGIPSPTVTEILCMSGVDFICLDGEHSQFRGESLRNVIRAANCHEKEVIVRVPDVIPHIIAEVLDAGACGVLVPRIRNAEEVRRAISAARFPPRGLRGVGPGRASGYGYHIRELFEATPPLIIVQVETLEALNNLSDILKVEGLDGVMIGPADLGISLSESGTTLSLKNAVEHISRAADQEGIPCGIFAADRSSADETLAWARFVLQGSDTLMLSEKVKKDFI